MFYLQLLYLLACQNKLTLDKINRIAAPGFLMHTPFKVMEYSVNYMIDTKFYWLRDSSHFYILHITSLPLSKYNLKGLQTQLIGDLQSLQHDGNGFNFATKLTTTFSDNGQGDYSFVYNSNDRLYMCLSFKHKNAKAQNVRYVCKTTYECGLHITKNLAQTQNYNFY